MKKRMKSYAPGKLIFLLLLSIGCCSAAIAQQETIITGIVKDAGSGDPLAGVTVEGGGVSTVTTESGTFSVRLRLPAKLVFSSVGYTSLTVDVTSARRLDIVLSQASQDLGEVVVVGYGTQKKTSLTAAVSTMKGKDISDIPLTNLSNGLGGRLSGVVVKQGSGEPGRDGSSIYIRGISSIGATQPLVIIDGIPRDYSQFSQMAPNSVESFTILKDAAAVAPYGVAGANGVILVTTKRGKSGAPVLAYSGYVGFQSPTTLPEYVSNYEYAKLRNEAAKNEGLPLPYSDYAVQKYKDGTEPDVFPSEYIWDFLVNRNALLTNHNIEISGGTERVKYYSNIGYQLQEGMWKTTSTNRYNLSFNLDAMVTQTTQIQLGLMGRVTKAVYPPADNLGAETGRIFELAGFATPQYGPFRFSNGMFGNHVASAIFGSGYDQYNTTALNAQLTINQQLQFVPGLSFKGTVAFDPTFFDNKLWKTPLHVATIDTTQRPYVITDAIFNSPKAYLSESFNRGQQLTFQSGLYYARVFNKHNLNVIGVFEAKNNFFKNFGVSRNNYDLDIDEINMGNSSPQNWTTSGSSSRAKQAGVVYRVAYDYAGKYMVEASGRYDGSYYFARGNRFGFFPAFSVGWRLSEEGFLQDWTALNNLKLRASHGQAGALAGSPFQYLSTYSVINTAHVLNGNPVMGLAERIEPNLNITWERAKKTNVGLEIGLWNGLLNAELDVFHEKRSNMLVSPSVTVPAEYGIGLSQVNAGIMENRGFEVIVNSRYSIAKNLIVSLTGNLTYAKNKLLQVFETPVTYNNPNRRQTGRPLGTQFGYKAAGLFQADDFNSDNSLKAGIATQPWGRVFPGDIRYQDMNDDGKIDENDLTVIGNPVAAPGIIYGFSPSISYKGLTVDLLFQGAAKVNYYYRPAAVMPFWNAMSAYKFNFDYWTPENSNASNPRLTSAPTTNNMQTSSFWVGNAAYLRLKSINISYSLPTNLLAKTGLNAARVYISGQNLVTWTDLIYDPEIGTNTSYDPNSPWTYPQQKVISLGVSLSF